MDALCEGLKAIPDPKTLLTAGSGRCIPLSAKGIHDKSCCQQPRQLSRGGYKDIPEVSLRQNKLPALTTAIPTTLRMELHRHCDI